MITKSKIIAICAFGLVSSLGFGACSQSNANEQSGISNVTVASAKEMISSANEMTIIDVRTPDEFSAGHIEKALNIDFLAPDFEAKLSQLPRDKEYLVYCRSGNRSNQSMAVFNKLGFTNVKNVQGGYGQLK